MSGSFGIALLWVIFGASHMALSSARTRSTLVERLGEKGFLGLFSVVAIVTFVPLVMFYFSHRHLGPELWHVPVTGPIRAVLYAGNAVAFILMASALLTPSPMMLGGKVREPQGVQLITRHGLFMGISIWALMHLVANAFVSDVAFFGGFVVFTLVGCYHQDRRKLATGGEEFARFYERTPFLPFTGRETMRGLRELSKAGVVVGIVATVGLRLVHPW